LNEAEGFAHARFEIRAAKFLPNGPYVGVTATARHKKIYPERATWPRFSDQAIAAQKRNFPRLKRLVERSLLLGRVRPAADMHAEVSSAQSRQTVGRLRGASIGKF
jgi:hypothetical protein